MVTKHEINSTMITVAVLSWAALILLVLMVIEYLDAGRTSDQIQECIKAGKAPHDCLCAFQPSKFICQQREER